MKQFVHVIVLQLITLQKVGVVSYTSLLLSILVYNIILDAQHYLLRVIICV